jgi:hypothetical protein
VLGHLLDAIRTDHSATGMFLDIGKQWDDQQPLLRRIEEMDEKITIDMPSLQLRRMGPFPLGLLRAKIDN